MATITLYPEQHDFLWLLLKQAQKFDSRNEYNIYSKQEGRPVQINGIMETLADCCSHDFMTTNLYTALYGYDLIQISPLKFTMKKVGVVFYDNHKIELLRNCEKMSLSSKDFDCVSRLRSFLYLGYKTH